MKLAFPPAFFAALLLAATHVLGQSTTTPPPQALTLPVVTSLGMPGYAFELVEIAGQPVKVVVDSQAPIVLPMVAATTTTPVTTPQGPGFVASFAVTNNSTFPRKFQFVDQYYAEIRIIFRVFDSNDTEVWQSYQTQVDIPPLAPKVTLNLAAHSSWQKTVFVPLQHPDHSLFAPGEYTLQAEVIGTPGYAASAPFTVSTLVGGPIVPIIPVPVTTK